MVTLGQRRGIGLPGGGPKRYVVDIDHESATVTRRRRVAAADATSLVSARGRVGAPSRCRARCWCSAARTARPRRPTLIAGRRRRVTVQLGTSRSGGWRRGRAWCSTTPPTRTCSAAASPADAACDCVVRTAISPPARWRAARACSARPGREGRHQQRLHVQRLALRLGGGGGATRRAPSRARLISSAWPAAGPVRSAACVSAGARRARATLARCIISVSPSTTWSCTTTPAGHQHQPAPREAVEAPSEQPSQASAGGRPWSAAPSTHCRAPSSSTAASTAAAPDHPRQAHRQQQCGGRRAAAAVARRRRPTACTNASAVSAENATSVASGDSDSATTPQTGARRAPAPRPLRARTAGATSRTTVRPTGLGTTSADDDRGRRAPPTRWWPRSPRRDVRSSPASAMASAMADREGDRLRTRSSPQERCGE